MYSGEGKTSGINSTETDKAPLTLKQEQLPQPSPIAVCPMSIQLGQCDVDGFESVIFTASMAGVAGAILWQGMPETVSEVGFAASPETGIAGSICIGISIAALLLATKRMDKNRIQNHCFIT